MMKKIILCLTLALMTATTVFAAKAKPGITQLQLVDGTIVSATLHGDEHFSYYSLLDGTPLKKSDNGKYEIISTETLNARKATVINTLKTRANGIGSIAPAYFPHTDSPKALVILVQFQDVKFKSCDPVATFNHYLNSDFGTAVPSQDVSVFNQEDVNYGSVKEYFKECSMGKFTPQFDIVGPYTISKKSAYYGKDDSDGNDQNFKQMISEACAQAAADKVDFSKYDNNGDKFVDLVYIIYAGYSQSISGNSDDYLWPKSGTDNFYKYNVAGNKITPQEYLIYNGCRVCRYGLNNELNGSPDSKIPSINGIGLFCHEFSHTMGLPDHYDTEYKDADNQSPEFWDVMDAGEYTDNGYRPTPYSPWQKMLMGWATPTTLDNTQAQQLTLEPYDQASKAYKIEADVNEDNFRINENYSIADPTVQEKKELMERAKGEFLLLQNIRNEGWYKALPGYGLLVWRIDYSDIDKVHLTDSPNNTVGIPRVTIVPADGLIINQANIGNNKYTAAQYWESCLNDPFPAYKIGKDGSDINSLTEVNFNWSTMTTHPLYNIAKDEATGIVSFDYLKDFKATGIENTLLDKDATSTPTEYFDLEGRKIATPLKGHLYITNKGKKVIY
jgi:immune inhibitor A